MDWKEHLDSVIESMGDYEEWTIKEIVVSVLLTARFDEEDELDWQMPEINHSLRTLIARDRRLDRVTPGVYRKKW